MKRQAAQSIETFEDQTTNFPAFVPDLETSAKIEAILDASEVLSPRQVYEREALLAAKERARNWHLNLQARVDAARAAQEIAKQNGKDLNGQAQVVAKFGLQMCSSCNSVKAWGPPCNPIEVF